MRKPVHSNFLELVNISVILCTQNMHTPPARRLQLIFWPQNMLFWGQNGHHGQMDTMFWEWTLGWHHMSRVETCYYFSSVDYYYLFYFFYDGVHSLCRRPLGKILSVLKTPKRLYRLENITRANIRKVVSSKQVKTFGWTVPLTVLKRNSFPNQPDTVKCFLFCRYRGCTGRRVRAWSTTTRSVETCPRWSRPNSTPWTSAR